MAGGLQPPSALPGISPTGGEISWGLLANQLWRLHSAFWLANQEQLDAVIMRHVISPLVGEMAGRPEGASLLQRRR